MMMVATRAVVGMALATCGVWSRPAPAQEAQAAQAAQADTGDVIADIVVTAEKRSARLQDVPIPVAALSSDQLAQRGIEDFFDLGRVTPGLNTNRTVGFGTPFLRGIGTTNVSAGDEPSVATYIDGFYQGVSVAAQVPFNNIERVEVLKGPQGTLYGRNAAGGLINIITAQPHESFEGRVYAGYATYDTVTADAYLNSGLARGVAANLSVAYRDQGRGYSRDLEGGTVGRINYLSVRPKLRFELGGNSSLTLGAEYVRVNNNLANVDIPFPGTVPLTAGEGVVYATAPHRFAGSIDPRFRVEQYGGFATLDLDLGFARLVSLSQYRHIDSINQVEGDGTTADGVLAGFQVGVTPGQPAGTPLSPQLVAPLTFSYYSAERFPYFATQEVQLVSDGTGPLKWIVGGFFQASKDAYHPLGLFYEVDVPPVAAFRSFQTTRALAGFAQATYSLDDHLTLTLGGRYSTEVKRVGGTVESGGASLPFDDRARFSSFTYHASVDYRFDPALMVYASTSKGFKSGVFNSIGLGDPPVRPEIIYAYQAGFKADPARFVRINGAAYHYDYRDLQLYFGTPAGLSKLTNAARASMDGAELELEVRPASGWSIQGSFGWERAIYKRYPGAQVYLPSPSGGLYAVAADVSGNRIVRTPETSGNLGTTYRFAAAGGTIELGADAAYSGDFFWDVGNLAEQRAYVLVNASARYRAPKGWSVSVWGKNLTDTDYAIYRNPQQRYDQTAYGEPVTAGVTLGWDF